MLRKLLPGLLAVTLLTTAAFAQNSTSGSPRVQGVPAGYGDPVQVTIRNTDGSAPAAIPVSVGSIALPTGASTSAAQATAAASAGAPGDTACASDTASCNANQQRQRLAQRLTTINTTLGTPFQAGSSIGNTTFAATQSGTWNIGSITTLPALPANQSSNVAQINAVTPLMGNGVTGTGSLRVTLASDTTSNTNPLLINQSQVNGVAMLAGNGVTGTGSQRVTIASDNTAFSVNAAQATASSLNAQVVGTIASGSSDSGNPVKVGGRYNSTLPTLTDGLRGDLQVGTRGALSVQIMGVNSTAGAALTAGTADGNATGNIGLQTFSYGAVFNGTTWDRMYGTTAGAYAQGNVASAASDSGNPVKVGGRYNTTLPTLTDGQRGDMQIGTRGSLAVTLFTQNSAAALQASSPGDAASNSQTGLLTNGYDQVFNGTTWDRQRGDVNGIVVQPALSTTFWNYAAASGGILNTTVAVTIRAAAGASVRNYLSELQIDHDTLGSATEVAVRDGASGTVLWRGRLQTSVKEGYLVQFNPPLRGTANTLMEFVTLTATITGGVYVNAQGYTGN